MRGSFAKEQEGRNEILEHMEKIQEILYEGNNQPSDWEVDLLESIEKRLKNGWYITEGQMESLKKLEEKYET